MSDQQLLHLVFGGELTSTDSLSFSDVSALDIVGIFPDYASAEKAWRAASQRSVDHAYIRYFVVHLHHLMDPEAAMDLKGRCLSS